MDKWVGTRCVTAMVSSTLAMALGKTFCGNDFSIVVEKRRHGSSIDNIKADLTIFDFSITIK